MLHHPEYNKNRRVVVTGRGIVSCIGNSIKDVEHSLRTLKSGIMYNPLYQESGMRSHVSGTVQNINPADHIDRKYLRFMGDAASYCALAMQQAIKEANLTPAEVSNERTGIITGSGGGAPKAQRVASNLLEKKGIRRVGPYWVTQTMASTTSACLATTFKILGVNYSVSSACATSAHCIGNAAEQIVMGKQDVMFAGGGEEEAWSLAFIFDAMGALSTSYNATPLSASRPYDVSRDGFVIAGGGGVVVLEELEHARARGATIYAELTGYGSTSDGVDMVAPSGEGAKACMRQALAGATRPVDYVNAHGTSTPAGDIVELKAITEAFDNKPPKISATKSLTGHSLGAAGVHEAIYSLIMLENNFISGSANITELDPEAKPYPIQAETIDTKLNCVLSNSFGFGGTNGCLVFERLA